MGRMRWARFALAVVVAAAALPVAQARAFPRDPDEVTVTRQPVSFSVTNPLVPGSTYTVRGELVRPLGCASSVLLAEHGLSYGYWAWDFPYQPATYSMARGLAGRGYATVAIDELGYGASDHPNGYTLTVQSYAAITDQIITQLRTGAYTISSGAAPRFSHVGLIGHSAGSEIVELAAGLYHDADVVIPTGYAHTPTGVSVTWLADEWIPGDNVRAAQSDYEYFETDPQIRAAAMYNLAVADPLVVARDTQMANLTPSGEILSIGVQPSRLVVPLINVPVLLVLAQDDALFQASGAGPELALFASAPDRSVHVVPVDGHVLSLHPNAPQTTAFIASWLDARQSAMPRC